jgi:hypothetical protein
MPSPIAVCPTHGPFAAEQFKFSSRSLVRFTRCAVQCPICRKDAPIIDGTYEFVGQITRLSRAVPVADLRALQQLARQASSGTVTSEQAIAQAAEINPAFESLNLTTENKLALWALLCAIIALLLQGYAVWDDNQTAAQAHQDAQEEIKATRSVEQVQQKIYGELRRQADATAAMASGQQGAQASPEKTPAPAANRHERRKAAKLAKRRR